MPLFDLVPIHAATPPDTYPPVQTSTGSISVSGVGMVGLIGGALGGAAWVASRRFTSSEEAAAIVEANSQQTSQNGDPNVEDR
jgi:hypothetical protein